MMLLGGMPLYIDDQLGLEHHRKQVRFPRSKKARIRKKWAKQSWNWQRWTTQKAVAYKVGNTLVMNSKAYEEIMAKAL